ncbi:MAG: hypothetical protein E4H20_09720 [Spirochaetales bacterium]|nr:MAG: hypothetical protein E4H20_09720 [Spirochaetales bacterium]
MAGRTVSGKTKSGVEKTSKTTPDKKKPSGVKSEKAERKVLADELVSLIPELDAEGLAFLIEQARVHLYNLRVLALEEEGQKLERSSARTRDVTASGAAAGKASAFSIEAASDRSSFHIVYEGKWKLFSSSEMLAIVKIVSSPDQVDQVAGRLYRWLKAERSDVFQDIPLSGSADFRLKVLVALLRKTFTIKKDR